MSDLAAYLLFVLDFTDGDPHDEFMLKRWRDAQKVTKHAGDCTGKAHTCTPCYLANLKAEAAEIEREIAP